MKLAAIRAVGRFSRVSGLLLNVHKSVAIDLRKHSMSAPSSDHATRSDSLVETTEQNTALRETASTRYLGHIAGCRNTSTEAWKKAFKALMIRLALAKARTNTAQQRASIAAAIIVPKLLYVARHAWPTPELVKQAERRIKNFIWNASFAVPIKHPKGWIQAAIAEQKPKDGGTGVPNFLTELIAMSAAAAGNWALSENKLMHDVGDILQTNARTTADHVVPIETQPIKRIREDMRLTGRPWTQLLFTEHDKGDKYMGPDVRELRSQLRHNKGLSTRWQTEGLKCECKGLAHGPMLKMILTRKSTRGEFMIQTFGQVPLTTVALWNVHGERNDWKDYRTLFTDAKNKTSRDIVQVTNMGKGQILFKPTAHLVPMESVEAHLFRYLCLAILATYPELSYSSPDQKFLKMTHQLEDKHHIFEVVSTHE